MGMKVLAFSITSICIAVAATIDGLINGNFHTAEHRYCGVSVHIIDPR